MSKKVGVVLSIGTAILACVGYVYWKSKQVVKQVGLEIWDQTSGADAVVFSSGLNATLSILVSVGNSVMFKQPADSHINPSDRVDLYEGEFGLPSTFIETVIANSTGYWQFEMFADGIPESERGTSKRYFVYVNNSIYSDGIRVTVL